LTTPSKNATIHVDNLAGDGGARPQAFDHVGIVPRRHEADILAICLFGIRQAKFTRQFAHARLWHGSERKPQSRELRARGREQEITLVAIRVGGPVKGSPAPPVVAAHDIMAGRQEIGAEVVRGVEEIGEFQVLIAGDARDRSFASDIGSGERLDHLLAKALLVVEHVVGNVEPRCDVPGVMDILPGAARALPVRHLAMVVELHRDADNVIAVGRQQRRRDRRVDAARHRDDDAGFGGGLIKTQTVQCAVHDRRERWRGHINLFAGECRTQAYVGVLAQFAKPIAQFGCGRHSKARRVRRLEFVQACPSAADIIPGPPICPRTEPPYWRRPGTSSIGEEC
jgi:hypothetical protein